MITTLTYSGISSLEFEVFFHIFLAFRFIKASPFSSNEITLPEYSASSRASTTPPLLFKPFHLVQNNLEQRIGLSSTSKAPAFVKFPSSSVRPNETKSFSSKLLPVHFLYLARSCEYA